MDDVLDKSDLATSYANIGKISTCAGAWLVGVVVKLIF